MDSDPILWQIVLQVVLIGLNAVFACAEIAVISMNDNKLAQLVQEGDKRAIRLAHLTSQPARFLATIQVAITLSGFLGSAFAAENFSDVLVEGLLALGVGIPTGTLDAISVIVITLILSYFTLVFGELVPKRIAMKKAEALALGMSGMISFISKLFAPIVWVLTNSTNVILRLVGVDPSAEEEEVSEEEIRMMVDIGSKKGVIDSEEREIINNLFDFDDITVGEFATHRTEISFLWLEESMEEWDRVINESRFSRYPVCDQTVDNIVGVLNAKDYFRLQDKSKESVLENAVKPAYFVPDGIYADVLFRQMKQSGNYLAVVLDEYGGMSGIVTMNDLLEQLVGDLEDEHSNLPVEPEIEQIDADTWKIRGCAPLDDVVEKIGVPLPIDEFDTFGGFVFGKYGSVPQDGSIFEIECDSLHINVVEIKEHRLEEAIVRVEKIAGETE